MNKKFLTPLFTFSTVILIAIYDVYIILKEGNEESISAHILSMGEVTPFLPLLLGFTFGHLTWPNKKNFTHNLKTNYYSYGFFLVNTPPAIYDVYQMYLGNGKMIFPEYQISAVFPFLIAYVLGHYWWPMKPVKWSGRFRR